MATPPTVLYIGGMGRSGSTLLDRMLGQVPGMASVGELFLLFGAQGGDDRCGCGEPLATCPFWTEVLARVFDGSGPVPDEATALSLQQRLDRNRHLSRIAVPALGTAATRADTERFGALLRLLYTTIGEVSGATVVVDSSKHVSTAFHLRRAGVDARLVHLVRDPRGMAYSWTKQVAKPESTSGAEMDRFSPGRSAARWLAYNGAFEVLARTGTPATHLFYEDLVTRPEDELTRVFTDLDLPVAPDLAFLADGRADLGFSHTVAGNPMRFESGPLRLRLDDEWRARMPPRQRQLVSLITAPMRAGYGYVGPTGRAPGAAPAAGHAR